MQSVKNVVLVHGAWADGSVGPKLFRCCRPKGAACGVRQNPLTSIADDVAATNRMINAQKDGPVSQATPCSGAVITEAGNNPKVAGLVYVAAFAPDEGETLGGLAQRFSAEPPVR